MTMRTSIPRPRLAVAFSLVFLILPVSSSGITTFENTYGGTGEDEGACVQQTSDGGYIIAGNTNSFGSGPPGYRDVYLIKTDSLGETLWTRTYGGTDDDRGVCVQQTLDGGYVIAGETWWSFAPRLNFYLVKVDSIGNMQWQRAYLHWGDDYCTSVRQTADKGYIMAGFTNLYWLETSDIYLVKTDSLGQVCWAKAFGGPSQDYAGSVCETDDGGYAVGGWTENAGTLHDAYLVKTDSLGEVKWSRRYGASGVEEGWSMHETMDGGFILGGVTTSFGNQDVYLVRTNHSGDSVWACTYDGGGWDWARSVRETRDGGFIATGNTWSFGLGYWDVLLAGFDSQGNTLWARPYGGHRPDRGSSVQQTTDGGYIVCGTTESSGAGGSDVYLIKTDKKGLVGACQPVEPPQMRTQGYWRRQCKDDSQEDVCNYADSVHLLADLFDAYDCDSICDLMNVDPPENDMCRKARRQYMALLLNTASGKISVCNCLEDGREVGDVIAEIDSLLSNDPDFHTCEYGKTLADGLNSGIGIVPCDTFWAQAPPRAVQPPSISVVPSPFARSTVIEYEVKGPGRVRLGIYDKAGRLVRTLVDAEQPVGPHHVEWDGFDSSMQQVPAGVYFSRLELGNSVSSSKLVLLR
jgi:hypothetical protein